MRLEIYSFIPTDDCASFSVRWYAALRTHRRECANHENGVLRGDELVEAAYDFLLKQGLLTVKY